MSLGWQARFSHFLKEPFWQWKVWPIQWFSNFVLEKPVVVAANLLGIYPQEISNGRQTFLLTSKHDVPGNVQPQGTVGKDVKPVFSWVRPSSLGWHPVWNELVGCLRTPPAFFHCGLKCFTLSALQNLTASWTVWPRNQHFERKPERCDKNTLNQF